MKVGIIGLGGVGEACAHLLAARGTVRSLVLANRNLDVAHAVRMDLEQSRAWGTPLSARAVLPWQPRAFSGCDVIIVCAGPRLRGDELRAAKATATAKALEGGPGESIAEALTKHLAAEVEDASPERDRSILLVVSNPVEGTVTWLAERTGWSRKRIMGLGTTVETVPFSRFAADSLDVDATSVWTEVIGEHGSNIDVRDRGALETRVAELGGRVDVPDLLRRTTDAAAAIRFRSEAVGRTNAKRLVKSLADEFDDLELTAEVKAKLEALLAAALSPPATRFAIAASAAEVVQAIADDRGRILPVSGFTDMGLPDVALAIPFIIGRAGILGAALQEPVDVLRRAADSVQEQAQAMRVACPPPPERGQA